MDRSEAYNLLFSTDSSKPSEPLAQWVFISPDSIMQFGEWLRTHRQDGTLVSWESSGQAPLEVPRDNPFHGPPDGTSPTRPLLTEAGIMSLQSVLGNNNVVVVMQKHGDLVHVPPGWMHQVTNLGPCVKLAFVFLKPGSVGAYLEVYNLVQKHGLFRHFHTDYVGLQVFLKKRLLELAAASSNR